MTLGRPGDGIVDWDAVRERLARSAAALDETLHFSAERARQVLEERARLMARPLPRPRQAAGHLEVVAFPLGRERYALETRHVIEVVRLTDLTPIPGVGGFLRDVTNVRGNILAVLDLRRLFGGSPEQLEDLSHIVVCGRRRPEFGILAEGMLEVRSIDIDDVYELDGAADQTGRDFLRGITDDALAVVDGETLLADPRLFTDEDRGPDGSDSTRGSE
jgi:purine-binding chemotaxis protein CheW